MKRWQSILLGILISAATLYFAFHNVTLNTLGDALSHGRYVFIVPGIALGVLGLVLRGLRWRSILDGRMETVHSVNILNASYLFNTILPLRLGEVVRAYLATRVEPPVSAFTALSSVVVERLTDLLAVVACVAVALALAPVDPQIEAAAKATGILALIGVIVLVVFAVRRQWAHILLNFILVIIPFLRRFNLTALLDRVLDGIAPLASPRRALAIFGWTVLSWLTSVALTYVVLLVFFPNATLDAALLVTAVASLAVAIPAVPGNVGPFEAASILGLIASGLISANDPAQQGNALAAAILLHALNVILFVVLGMIGLAQEQVSLREVLDSARQMATRKPANAQAAAAAEN